MWTAQRLRSMRRAPRRWPTGPKLLFVASCRALSPPRHRGSARPVWVTSPATWWVRRGIFDDSEMAQNWTAMLILFAGGGDALLCSIGGRPALARVFHEGLTCIHTNHASASDRRARLGDGRGATRRAPIARGGLSLALFNTLQLTTHAPATGWTARREPYARRRRTRPSRPTPPHPAVSAPAARTRPSSSAAVDAPAPSAYPRRTRDSPPRARCESRARGRRRRTRRGYRRRRPEA